MKDINMQNDKITKKRGWEETKEKREEWREKRGVKRGERLRDRVLKRKTKQLLHYRRTEFYESIKIDYSWNMGIISPKY